MKPIILCICLFAFFSSEAQDREIFRLINRSNTQNQIRYVPAQSIRITGNAGVEIIRSVPSFYITEFEVTNAEYRQFVNYVLDSLAHTLLSHFHPGGKIIDWQKKIDWKAKELDALWLRDVWTNKAIDPGLITYRVGGSVVPVYPDTLVWLTDFNYSYNEPLVKSYFRHSKYDRYPVVGITCLQALAYCDWKERQLNVLIQTRNKNSVVQIQLPGQGEWEAAASSTDTSFMSLLFKNGSYNLNMGQVVDKDGLLIKDYADDGFFYTAPVHSYQPNVFGLYNMIGNVAEWVLNDSANVYLEHDSLAVVLGGGWDSEPLQLKPSSVRRLPAAAAHSFVGFRYTVRITSK